MLRLPDAHTPPSALTTGIGRLLDAGVPALGHVDLGYGARPLSQVMAELRRWADLRVSGVFLDHAPTAQYQLDVVVQTIQAAHHNGLHEIVLNPGGPVNPVYRRLGVTVCTFEGSWRDYLTWSGDEAAAGDGHLVFGVPHDELAVARALVLARGAGLYLIAEHTDAYSAPGPPPHPVGAAR